jgi:hypothetical protein
MSARDLERLDHTADDFAEEPSRWETDAEQAPVGAKSQPHTAGNHRPSRAERDERRARQALTQTRGRVSSSTLDPPVSPPPDGTPGDGLRGPGHYWANAIDLLERAAVNLKTAAYRTQNHASATIGHREADQVRMLLDRIRPEQHVIDTHGTKRSVA